MITAISPKPFKPMLQAMPKANKPAFGSYDDPYDSNNPDTDSFQSTQQQPDPFNSDPFSSEINQIAQAAGLAGAESLYDIENQLGNDPEQLNRVAILHGYSDWTQFKANKPFY